MAGEVTCTIGGLDELERCLLELAPKVAKKAVRDAGRRGAAVLETAFEADAPRLTGFLATHFKISTRTTENGMTVSVGPDPNSGYFKGATRSGNTLTFRGEEHFAAMAALFEEFGTKHQAAKPFMGPAAERSFDEVVSVFIDELWNRLQDLAEK